MSGLVTPEDLTGESLVRLYNSLPGDNFLLTAEDGVELTRLSKERRRRLLGLLRDGPGAIELEAIAHLVRSRDTNVLRISLEMLGLVRAVYAGASTIQRAISPASVFRNAVERLSRYDVEKPSSAQRFAKPPQDEIRIVKAAYLLQYLHSESFRYPIERYLSTVSALESQIHVLEPAAAVLVASSELDAPDAETLLRIATFVSKHCDHHDLILSSVKRTRRFDIDYLLRHINSEARCLNDGLL